MNRDAILNKAHELAKKAELINGIIPKSTLIAVAIDMAEFGYHQAEKELALTAEDIREIFSLFSVVAIDLADSLHTNEDIYKEILRRFNELKK